jgi:hypothetical protein
MAELNLAELILAENDRTVSGKPIPTPEWPSVDGRVHVRALSGDDRDAHETFVQSLVPAARKGKRAATRFAADTRGIRAHMVMLGACDKDGEAIFTKEQLDRLGQKNGTVIDRLDTEIRKISGMIVSEDDEKNSETTHGEGSS